MLQKLARLAVVVCALFAAQAYALGLGDINVRSKLNQRFSATIPVLGATAAQLDSFTVRLASPEDFNRAGIDRSDYLSSLKFSLEEVPGGARVVISSDQLAREPFLNFIVEARSPDGKLLREYTVLLDPPTIADNTAPAQPYSPPAAPVVPVTGGPDVPASHPDHLAPTEAAQLAAEMPGAKGKAGKPAKGAKAPKQAVAAAPAPAPAAEAPAPAPAPAAEPAPVAAAPSGGGGTYGPTAPQETFWSIANKLRPGPQVTMDQVLLAIYRANPSAFDKGSFNGLLKGRTLQVPSLADMQETPPAQAKSLVDSWRRGTRPAAEVKKNAESVAAAPAAAPAPKAEKPKPAAKSKPVKPAPLPPPELPAPAPAAAPAPAPAPAKPVEAPKPAPAPAAAAPAPAPTPPSAPAAEAPKPQAPATPAAPAAEVPKPAAETPPPAAPGAAAPAEAAKPKPVPPPSGGFLDDSGTLIGAGIFIIAILGFGYFIFRRRKEVVPDFSAKAPPAAPSLKKGAGAAPKAATTPPPPPPAAAKKPGPPGPPPMPKPQALKLGDTTALPDELPAPPKPASPPDFPRADEGEAPLARTALDDTARIKAADAAGLAPPQRVLQESIPPATPPPLGGEGGDIDFDLTSQFEAQTLSINLDANDPLSEADFHLAYGLYDEAASLLKQALAKEPNRQDLRVKLAETYFAGGKPLEFQETAEALHGNVSPAEWQKIAIMGRQLSPDAPLFKSDGNAPAPDIDLTLGDSIGPAAAQVIGAAPAKSGHDVIDFDFDSELMKSAPVEAKPAAAPAAEGKADFDLSHFDLSAEPAPAGDHSIEFNLDELDLTKTSGGPIASGDEIGTKLDLARVYADMGDNDAARGLLNEVLATGNATQKGEAEALLKRLSA